MKIKAKTLSGFMELSPEKQIVFNCMKDKILEVFKLNGLSPMDTPILEDCSVLLAKAGGETEKQIYRFKKGEADICMRFDLTVPFAKYVAIFQNELTFPFRRFQIGKVFRGERAQKGRLREFYQCDMDIIEESEAVQSSENISNSLFLLQADAECIDVLNQVFNALNLSVTIKISNRKILNGVIEHLNLIDKATEIFTLLDKKDKIKKSDFFSQLSELTSFSSTILNVLNCKKISDLNHLKIENSTFKQGVNELHCLFEILDARKLKNQTILDLSIVRGLDYYTGTIFEVFLNQISEKISVCGGGRYDNLADCYTNRKFSGVGMSVGLSRLFDLLDKNNMLTFTKSTLTQIAIIPLFKKTESLKINKLKKITNISQKNNVSNAKVDNCLKTENFFINEIIQQCIDLSKFLIKNQINSEILYFNKSFKNKLNYANKKQIPYIVVIGENEISSKKFSLKNMKSGKDFFCDESELLEILQKNLNFKIEL